MEGKRIERKSDQPLAGRKDYQDLVAEIKARVAASRTKIAVQANQELVELYWHVGKAIVQRQEREGWGAKVLDQLERDLKGEGRKGFSKRNLQYMATFARVWPRSEKGDEFAQPVAAQISWRHHQILLDQVSDQDVRLWYAERAVENGWSSRTFALQIKSALHGRQGKALSNFKDVLPSPDSELVQEMIKDPYDFSFLSLPEKAREADIEKALLRDVERFLLELGKGFALVGRQYKLEIGSQEFFLDLLFYHPKLRRYLVIDLKIGPFEPEFAGKMNFYMNAVDDLVADGSDGATLGLILCPSRNDQVVEYALRGVDGPIAAPRYTTGDTSLTEQLPGQLEAQLPSVEELESGIARIAKDHSEQLDEALDSQPDK